MRQPKDPTVDIAVGAGPPRTRFVAFLPAVIVVMGALMLVAVFAASTTGVKIALVVAILGLGLAFSTAMLKSR